MKTLYLTDSCANIIVDKDNDTVSRLGSQDRYDVRDVYYIDEPMHVVYEYAGHKEELDVRKGDILLRFYNSKYNKYMIDSIRTKQWAANIRQRREMEQKEKEEWAARNADKCCECCEDCCCDNPEPFMDDLTPTPAVEEKTSLGSKIKKLVKKVKKSKK